MPTDVLALGEHLVRELDLDERGDTLSRWMAHHVAELIDRARALPLGRGRNEVQTQTTQTILKIWEHRENLPHDAYPLAPFKDVLKILSVLQPNDNPYRFSRLSRTDELAAILFDRLSRLIILLLLMHAPNAKKSAQSSPAAANAMNDEEQQVLKRLSDWAALLPLPPKKAKTRTNGRKKSAGSARLEAKALHDTILTFIDDSAQALANLRNEMTQTVPQ